jgi:1-acyl-sn-glycerol-3-phosphate acyltransferase
LIGCAKIDRSNREAAIASTRQAAERVRQGRSFIVYPEGTRSRDGNMLPFKKGAFHLAIEVGVPVVPVTVDGTYEAMPKGTIGVNPGTVYLTVHDPIDVSQYTPEMAGELAERAWQAVHSGFRKPTARAAAAMPSKGNQG